MGVSFPLVLLGTVLLAWSVGRIVVPFGVTFLRHHTVVATNYAGDVVPTGYGLVLLFAYAAVYAFIAPFFLLDLAGYDGAHLYWTVGTASMWIVLLGWLDDTLGDHTAKGFRGHIAVLAKDGVFTTGLLKAVGGGVAAFAAARVTSSSVWEWAIDGLLIALSTNWLNLLDLRPGRAIKFYLLGAVSLFLVAWPEPFVFLFTPLMLLAAATVREDLGGRIMLGDSGANLLGMQLGIFAALALPVTVCGAVVFLFAAGHIYAERYSLTELINRISWLKKLDSWGRAKP